MKKEYLISLLVFFGMLGLLYLKKPLESALNQSGGDETWNNLLAGSLSRVLVVAGALFLIGRLRLSAINGFRPVFRVRNVQALLIPVAIAGMGVFSNLSTYRAAPEGLLILFIVSVLLVGFAEELTFRGIILPLFIRAGRPGGSRIYPAVLLSSLLFGLVHYVNLFRQPGNFDGVTSQVIFAFCIGIFFAGLFLRMGNVVPAAFFHALINFAFGAGELKVTAVVRQAKDGTDLASLLFTLLIFGLIAASGLLMVYWTDREAVRREAGASFTDE